MGSWDTHFTSGGVKNPALAHRVVLLDHPGGWWVVAGVVRLW